MFKRFAPLMVLVVLLSLILTACGGGGSDDTPPTYSGAKSVTLTDDIKKAFSFEEASKKGAKLDLYSTADAATKIKTQLQDDLKKKGWSEDTSLYGGSSSADSLKQIESAGGFALAYGKGDKGVIYLGLPGSIAGLLGITGITEKDTMLMVASAPKSVIKSS